MRAKIMDLGEHIPGGSKMPQWLLGIGERLLGFHVFNVAHSKIEDDQEAGCTAVTGGERGQAQEGWGVLVTPGPCPCERCGTLLLTWQRA